MNKFNNLQNCFTGQMILPQGSLTLIQRPGQQAQLVQTIQQQPQIVKNTDIWRTTQVQQNQQQQQQQQVQQQQQQQTIQVQQQVAQPVQQRKGLTLSVYFTFQSKKDFFFF